MRIFLDTGVLLRTTHTAHPMSPSVRAAIYRLQADGHTFACGIQNVAEFWNVTTRPSAARGGFGLSLAVAEQAVAVLERWVTVLCESATSYAHWRQLVVRHGVSGVQVHDARLVAVMEVEGVSTLLTLNPKDFTRYTHIAVRTPEQIAQGAVTGVSS